MDKALKIAHCVESYSPAKGGMPEVVRQLSERMVRKGHSVTVFTSHHPERKTDDINGVKIRAFSISGNKVEGLKGEVEEYFQALKGEKFDVIVFFAAQQWATDAVIDRLDEIAPPKVFVPTGFSHLNNPKYKLYYENMKAWMLSFDKNVFLSDDYIDVNFAKANGITKNVLIPNGAAEEEFAAPATLSVRKKMGVPQNDLMVLHVGTYTGVKGHREALNIFIRSSVVGATLVLVGDKIHHLENAFRTHYSYWFLRILEKLKGKRIVFAELNREDTVSVFREADLFLFPSNVECSPIVLFECMAAGIPFLASPAGNTEEIIRWTDAGWILPRQESTDGWVKIDIKKSVKVFSEIVSDRQQMKIKCKRGHEIWMRKFTWEIITDQYIHLYYELTLNH